MVKQSIKNSKKKKDDKKKEAAKYLQGSMIKTNNNYGYYGYYDYGNYGNYDDYYDFYDDLMQGIYGLKQKLLNMYH